VRQSGGSVCDLAGQRSIRDERRHLLLEASVAAQLVCARSGMVRFCAACLLGSHTPCPDHLASCTSFWPSFLPSVENTFRPAHSADAATGKHPVTASLTLHLSSGQQQLVLLLVLPSLPLQPGNFGHALMFHNDVYPPGNITV